MPIDLSLNPYQGQGQDPWPLARLPILSRVQCCSQFRRPMLDARRFLASIQCIDPRVSAWRTQNKRWAETAEDQGLHLAIRVMRLFPSGSCSHSEIRATGALENAS